MRSEFERAGVWRLMRKRIAASQYTQPGDRSRLTAGIATDECGCFRQCRLRMTWRRAKGMAYSARSVAGWCGARGRCELELTAIVETNLDISDAEQYGFGVQVMEREAIRVLTVADLGACQRRRRGGSACLGRNSRTYWADVSQK
jgi:hypothetical protein